MNKKAVLLLSGGLDSTTLAYDLLDKGYKVYPITFDYGQKHCREVEAAKATCEFLGLPHKVVSLDVLGEIAPSSLTRRELAVPNGHYRSSNMKKTVVPNRNMVLISLATSYAIGIGANHVFYAAHSGDHSIYPDCRPEFFKKLSGVIAICDYRKVILSAPYIYLTKGDILRIGMGLGVDYSKTWTCYKGGERACGTCGSCSERLEAFSGLGVEDPLPYEANPVTTSSSPTGPEDS